jgi:hypothetical protein
MLRLIIIVDFVTLRWIHEIPMHVKVQNLQFAN